MMAVKPMIFGDGMWHLPHAHKPTKEEALLWLNQLKSDADAELAHQTADDILLALVHDSEIESAFDAVVRWYA